MADLIRQLEPDVQLSLTNLHKEIINIAYSSVHVDSDRKRELVLQFKNIVDRVGKRSLTSKSPSAFMSADSLPYILIIH